MKLAELSIVQMLILAVVILGGLAIVYVAAGAMGVAIPAFVVTLFWIVVVVILAVFAIKLIAGML